MGENLKGFEDDPASYYLYPASDKTKPQIVVEKRKSRIGWLLLLPTLILLFLSAGLGAFLLVWLTVIHGISDSGLKSVWDEGAFIVNEGRTVNQDRSQTAKLLGLTISTATTNVVSLTAPFLVGLAAYCVAGMWLKAQERDKRSGLNLLTPLQYGLLVKLCSVSGLKAMYDGSRYLFRKKSRLLAVPAYISTAFTLVVTIYLTTHFVSLADLWLHTTSSAVIQNTTRPFVPGSNDHLYGIAVNSTGLANIRVPDIQKAGLLIAANASSSAPNRLSVITLHDEQDLAVIVPSDADPELLWTGPSFAMHSTCSNITPQCLSNSSGFDLNYNCSDAGYPDFPLVQNPVIAAPTYHSLLHGSVRSFDNTGANPTTVVLELDWPILIEGITCPNSFATSCGLGIASGFSSCQISFFNVTVQRRGDGTYGLSGTPVPTGPYLSSFLMFPFLYYTTVSQLHSDLFPYILSDSNDDSVMAAVSQEVSRTTLALFAGLLANVPAQNFFQGESTIVSRYPVAPVLTYVSLLFLYSLIALGIFAWASSIRSSTVRSADGKTKSTMLELVQAHLTDPMMIVASMLNTQLETEKGQGVGTDPISLYVEDHETPRLVVGVDDGSEGGSTFCVHEMRSRDGYEHSQFDD